jgi:hypothetical protein
MTRLEVLNQKLEKARRWIAVNEPFLSYVGDRLDIVYLIGVRTAATDGLAIYLDPYFFDSLSDEGRKYILMHETLHAILKHPIRSGDKEWIRFNVACDIVVNDIIAMYGYEAMIPKDAFRGRMFGLDGTVMTAEAVYAELPSMIRGRWKWQPDLDAIPVQADPEEISSTIDSIIESVVQSMVTKPKNVFEKLFIKSAVRRGVNRRLGPAIEKHLPESDNDYTYARTDKRFQGVLLPDFGEIRRQFKDVWFVVDVSGSMLPDAIAAIHTNIASLIEANEGFSCKVSFFSTVVTPPVTFASEHMLTEAFKASVTTSGTSYHVIFDQMPVLFKTDPPVLVVILTDSLAPYPDKSATRGIPVIWVLTDMREEPPFGEIVRLWNES